MKKGGNPAKSTHCSGRAITFTGQDGIKRIIGLAKTGNNTLQLTWETWWDGEDKEPFTTRARLGMDALNATMSLLAEFSANPGSFPDPEPIAPLED